MENDICKKWKHIFLKKNIIASTIIISHALSIPKKDPLNNEYENDYQFKRI